MEGFRRQFYKSASKDIGEKITIHMVNSEGENFDMEGYLVNISYFVVNNRKETIVISIHGKKNISLGLTFHHGMKDITDKIINLILDQEVVSEEWLREIGFGVDFKDSDYEACFKAVGAEE